MTPSPRRLLHDGQFAVIAIQRDKARSLYAPAKLLMKEVVIPIAKGFTARLRINRASLKYVRRHVTSTVSPMVACVAAIEDHLGGSEGKRLREGLHEWLPHIDRDRLDAREVFLGARPVKCIETHLYRTFHDELNGSAVDNVCDGQVSTNFAKRLLIGTDASDSGGLFAVQPSGNGTIEHVPGPTPGDADEFACPFTAQQAWRPLNTHRSVSCVKRPWASGQGNLIYE